MRNACQVCGGSAQTGSLVCRRCENRTKHHLGDMESHRQELETTLTRQVRMQAAVVNGPEPTQSKDGLHAKRRPSQTSAGALPYTELASDLLGAQRAILASWCKLIHDEIDATWPRADTVRAMALHIESRMPELRMHEAAGELVAEVEELVGKIMMAIDYPEDRHKVSVGRACPQQLDDDQCPGELIMSLPWEKERAAGKRQRVECPACGTVWLPEQFRSLGRQLGVSLALMDQSGVQRLARAIAG